MSKADNLNKLLNFIDELAKDPENEWFRAELVKRFSVMDCSKMSENLEDIRGVLQIRGRQSVDYNFINHNDLKNTLIIDNQRMENAALSLKELNEVERFYNFCVNAFYQIENLVNYYYYRFYNDINKLTDHLKEVTKNEQFPFIPTGKEKDISSIPMSTKLFCFGTEFLDVIQRSNLSVMREIRNAGSHRCQVIKKLKDKDDLIYKFLEFQSFHTVRELLKKIAKKIEEEFSPKVFETIGEITGKISDRVYIKLESGTTEGFQGNSKFKLSELVIGNKLRVTVKKELKNNKIIEVLEKL